MIERIALKPCPAHSLHTIDRGPATVFQRRSDIWGVYCQTCQCSTEYYGTEAEAIAAWNNRPALTEAFKHFAGEGVQQCDRDAAASIMGWTEGDQRSIRNARMDNCDEVQAFARHRSTAAAAERARIVAIAKAKAAERAALGYRDDVGVLTWMIDAIERGEV